MANCAQLPPVDLSHLCVLSARQGEARGRPRERLTGNPIWPIIKYIRYATFSTESLCTALYNSPSCSLTVLRGVVERGKVHNHAHVLPRQARSNA